MSLLSLIRKRSSNAFATATPATFATHAQFNPPTVASVATVAVANPAKVQADTPTILQNPDTLPAGDESLIRAWLAQIGETDPAIIAEVLTHCQHDTTARAYFLGRAMPAKPLSSFCPEIAVDRNPSTLPTIEESETDDRRTCQQCQNMRGRVCGIAKPERGALVVANVGYRPQPDTLHRCAGYLPNATDNDQRTGGERWPGLLKT